MASTSIDTSSPTPAPNPSAGDWIQTFGVLEQLTALYAFRRPFDVVLPFRELFGSTLRSRRALIPRSVAVGKRALISAAVPATCGVAIDVPLRYW